MKRYVIVSLVFALLGFAAVASAQSIRNPSVATFTASPDHAQVSSYQIGYFLPGATDPVQTADVGKPTPDATNTCTITLNVQPLGFGAAYIAKVKALAGTVASDWSEASNPFDRVPGRPTKPVVK